MTDFADFKAQIADWQNRQDWSDALVTSFIRMAEEKLNAEMRISRMIETATNTVTCRCGALPDDWLQMSLVSIASGNVPSGWAPLHYVARDEFFRRPDKWTKKNYTIEGRTIYFGGAPDTTEGRPFQISYYGEVPVFSDTCDSWVYTKYPSLYLTAAVMHAGAHAVGEEDKVAAAKAWAEDLIGKLNIEWLLARSSGSRLNRTRTRSFG